MARHGIGETKMIKGKGTPRDTEAQNRSLPKEATRSHETNPATGKGSSNRTVKKGE